MLATGQLDHVARALNECCLAGFAFTAGWVDVVTFHAFDSFGVLMTGNMVKLAISIFDDKKNGTDAGFYISIMMSYMLGCTLFQIIKRYFPSKYVDVDAWVYLSPH